MSEVWAILDGNKEISADDVAVGADNTILALDSETPLLIRSCIILQGYVLGLCVSPCHSWNKGDTLCLPQSYPNLIGCCLMPAQHNLVFLMQPCQKTSDTYKVHNVRGQRNRKKPFVAVLFVLSPPEKKP